MSERTGRLIQVGESFGVVLPRDWVRGMRVEKGDILTITYDADSVRIRATK